MKPSPGIRDTLGGPQGGIEGSPALGPCLLEYSGPLNAKGVATIIDGPYEHEVHRLWATQRGPLGHRDRVVPACGNPRCLDRTHLRIVRDQPTPVVATTRQGLKSSKLMRP